MFEVFSHEQRKPLWVVLASVQGSDTVSVREVYVLTQCNAIGVKYNILTSQTTKRIDDTMPAGCLERQRTLSCT